jgi:hypothetical protein
MITIQIAHHRASIEWYHWTSDSPELAGLLNAMLPEGGPSGSEPDPDRNAARAAVALLGGALLDSGPAAAASISN